MENNYLITQLLENYKEKFNEEQKIEKAIKLIEKGCKESNKDYQTYLKHNIAVAQTLMKLGLEKNTIIAGLCHNLTEMKLEEKEIEKELGKEILEMIQEKQRLEKALNFKNENTETMIKKLSIIMTTTPEVFMIQLAESLDKTKNVYSIKEEERNEFIKQAKEVYAPLATKLGLYQISSEINDLVFKYQNPEKYNEIEEKIKQIIEKATTEITEFQKLLEEELTKSNIKAKIYGRIKSVYSTNQKMKRKNISLDKIYDIIAIRIITNNEKECYETLGIVHTLAKPIPEEFDDYISKPKENGYRSLHTVVMIKNTIPIEVQIRTKEMHELAEYGIAAHWKYKGIKGTKQDAKSEWLKQIIEWEKETGNKTLLDIFGRQIFAITPKGEVIELPEGATIIDFAYAIHTDLGNKCIGAKINGKACQLSTQIKNGDIVEILTSEKQKPKISWLSIAKTQKARKKIKSILGLDFESKNTNKLKRTFKVNTEDKRIRFAKCCKPMPGDEIIGIKTTKRKISVHKINCEEIQKMKGKKIIVEWHTNKVLKTKIEITAKEGISILKELLNTLNEEGLSIESTTAKKTSENSDLIIFEVKTTSIKNIENAIEKITKMKKVLSVKKK
ncbi:MAG: TGS domain-containing protein [Candidatus Diapherotrites archaeon]